jgi:UDP-glucose 4-epimerase
MGMTKAIQERVYIDGNIHSPNTRFICARYGNVLASRGSVVPLFLDQIAAGGPVTITTVDMTRFLLTLEDAVDTIFAAASCSLGNLRARAPSSRIVDVASCLSEIAPSGLWKPVASARRKIHEIMVKAKKHPHRRTGRLVLHPSDASGSTRRPGWVGVLKKNTVRTTACWTWKAPAGC